MAAHQAPPSLGFSRPKHWSGLPFPSPMHESEKSKWSRSVVSDSMQPHGLKPTRLLRPWDFPGKSTGVGCHCLLRGLFLTDSKLVIYSKWYTRALNELVQLTNMSDEQRAAGTQKEPSALRGWGKIQGRTALVGPFRAQSDWGQPYFQCAPSFVLWSEGIDGVFIYLEIDETLA